MSQDSVTLDGIRRFRNIPDAYRALLGQVGAVLYQGTAFGEILRVMATASPYEEGLEKRRQEAEHALLGLALAHDLPQAGGLGWRSRHAKRTMRGPIREPAASSPRQHQREARPAQR